MNSFYVEDSDDDDSKFVSFVVTMIPSGVAKNILYCSQCMSDNMSVFSGVGDFLEPPSARGYKQTQVERQSTAE